MDETAGKGMDSWPVPVNIYEGREKLVRLTGLPKSMKTKAWEEIKTNCPALAHLLKEEGLRDIVLHFSAEIFIEAEHAPCLPQERLRGRNG
ncbi:hypothetical protein ACI77O_13005 [Pseudomonas tritici]|uniref:hypothetical protein n=1 Tax=Pseudomonas tritici TaxID=2745518 RepID=UPI00387B7334